jgi:hypothetical protein
MSRVLIGSISKPIPASPRTVAAKRRFSISVARAFAQLRRHDSGKAVEAWTAEGGGALDGATDPVAEFDLAAGQRRQTAVAPAPVAGRQIVQHELQLVAPELFGDRNLAVLVGKHELHSVESRRRGCTETIEKRQVGKQHREIGREFRHRCGSWIAFGVPKEGRPIHR